MRETVQLVVFRLADRSYGLRLAQVERVVRAVDVIPLPEAPANVLGAFNLQGTIVPVFNIRRRFGFAERAVAVQDVFIVARGRKRLVALAVDGALGVVQRGAEEIIAAQEILGGVDVIDGALQLDDDLILIHNLERFLSLDEEAVLEQAMAERTGDGA